MTTRAPASEKAIASQLNQAARVYVAGAFMWDAGRHPADALMSKAHMTMQGLSKVELYPLVMMPRATTWVPWEEDKGPDPSDGVERGTA